MKRRLHVTAAAILLAAGIVSLGAQGRGAPEWTTAGFDAQRTAWVRSDARLTKDAVQKGEFQFLWKMKFDNTNRQLNSLTTPVLLDLLIGYRGFKSLAFFGGAGDRVFSVDTDLARPYWTTMLTYSASTGGQPPGSWECPGGLMAMPSRRTAYAPAAFTGGGGGGGVGVRNGSAVGEPGKGAAVLSQRMQRPAPPPARGPQGAPSTSRLTGGGFGGVEPLIVMGSDGYVHALYVSNGQPIEPPTPFLPPDARPSALTWLDGVLYTTTSNGCGAAPNAVWAMDLMVPIEKRKPVSWQTNGGNVAGASAVAFGTDGTLYVAVGKTGSKAGNGDMADSIVALDRVTLAPKDWFKAPGADFNATPVVVRYNDKDFVAATANDGRRYLLDSASLGGPGHDTPLAASNKFSSGAAGSGAGLATFEEAGTTWIVATSFGPEPNGRVAAFKLVDQGGTLSLSPAWQSRDLISPLAPVVVSGMVFAVSSGEYRATSASVSAARRAQQSVPAVLYVLDAVTGKQMWSSGTAIASFARSGLSAGGGQVYVVTYDNHLYAFGIPLEH